MSRQEEARPVRDAKRRRGDRSSHVVRPIWPRGLHDSRRTVPEVKSFKAKEAIGTVLERTFGPSICTRTVGVTLVTGLRAMGPADLNSGPRWW